MSLILAGIDEAGYGPTLGPLAVGLSVFRVREWGHAETTPNLWTLLSAGVCREAGRGGKADAKGRIAVADSKQLKLANSVKSTHPLVHLERGVLAHARVMFGEMPVSDAALLEQLGAKWPAHRCYAEEPAWLPIAHEAGEIGIAANGLARAMQGAGVDLLAMRCTLVGEAEFNAKVKEFGTKAATSAGAIAEHLRFAWERWGATSGGDRLGIVCDRLGGRAAYAGFLRRAIGGEVDVIEEGEQRSRYVVRDEASGRRAGVAFLVEGESAHLPVALASMIAKYARELAMARFNRYWCGVHGELLGGELKPTAGYALDARRWLDDMKQVLSAEDRAALVRIA